MLNRNENVKVGLKPADLESFIDQLYAKCKNTHDVELLQIQLLNGSLTPINSNEKCSSYLIAKSKVLNILSYINISLNKHFMKKKYYHS